MVSLCGPRDVVRDRLAAFRDAGVGTLMVTPMAFATDDRVEQLRDALADARCVEPGLRFFLGAFGEPGHAFPMLALGSRLAARGHEVTLETWRRWRERRRGGRDASSSAAPEYPVFPTRERPLKPYEAVVLATAETRPVLARFAPDVVVHDILTLAPAMAGELEGVPVATLIPHLYPSSAPTAPPYALGARLPRTAAGRRLWRAMERPVQAGLRQGRRELNDARRPARPAAGHPPPRRDQHAAVPRRHVPPARVPARLAAAKSTSSGR